MNEVAELRREVETLRDRIRKLTEAGGRLLENVEFESVLEGVVDNACALTDAECGAIFLVDGEDGSDDAPFVYCSWGFTVDGWDALVDVPGVDAFKDYLLTLTSIVRHEDAAEYLVSLGYSEKIAEFMNVKGPVMIAPLRLDGVTVGDFYVSGKTNGVSFSEEDEKTLGIFVGQATAAISNARRYRDEQRARRDLEVLINTSPVGVVVMNARTGRPVTYNREAARLVSVLLDRSEAVEEIPDQLIVKSSDGQGIDTSAESLIEQMKKGERLRAEEIVIQTRDGRSVKVLLNATPVWSKEGVVESVIFTVQDLSPIVELQQLRAEFLAMVSHELRTPLASIKGSVTTLLGEPKSLDPNEMLQFFKIIDTQAERMRELINDLLDVALIETGTLAVMPEPTDIASLIDEATSAFISGRRRQTVVAEVEAGLPAVMADRRRIIQVLGNLLGNAAKQSDDGSKITISAVREGFSVSVAVVDEGVGVSPHMLPHLFRGFSRIRSDVGSSAPDFTGLGLAICKGIVEAHGGRIWGDSQGLGKGASFTLTLQVAEGMEAARDGEGRLGGDGVEVEGRTLILVVDDDPQTLKYVRGILHEAGYSSIVAMGADEALDMMEKKPELVILDLMLPGMDGVDLMRQIQGTTDVPTIFISAFGDGVHIARALDGGADDYLVKPFSPTELVARIRASFRRREGYRASRGEFVLHDLKVDYHNRRVWMRDEHVALTATEYAVLEHLTRHAGEVLGHEHFQEGVWGEEQGLEPQVLRTHIGRIRRKIGDDAKLPVYIATVPGLGYRVFAPTGRT